MQIEVLKAFVLTGQGTDKVSLQIALPNPLQYAGAEKNAWFHTEATAGAGAQWVREHVGIEPEMVKVGGA